MQEADGCLSQIYNYKYVEQSEKYKQPTKRKKMSHSVHLYD